MDANYTIKRNALTGSQRVHFSCPTCKTAVIFDLSDAGIPLPCPSCKVILSVPGERENRAAIEERKRTAQAEAEADAQAQAQKERERIAGETSKRQRDIAERREREAERQREQDVRTRRQATYGMRTFGLLLGLVGTYLYYVAATMNVSVGDVFNNGLLNQRLCYVIGASAHLTIGFVFIAAGAIGEQLARFAREMKELANDRRRDG
jgi:uncharacterized Zn finger protein (UPF0148 family)